MKIKDYLSKEEVAYFTEKSDLRAWMLVIGNWSMIAAIFAVVGLFPNPLTIVLAIVLLGGRQMGLSVLMHDAGHKSLFRTPWLNDVIGQWLCAHPVLNDQVSYARGHLAHHKLAGTHEDPDLPNYQAYPVSRESFKRKVTRDLTGQTGYKLMKFVVKGASGVISKEPRTSAQPFLQEILVQVILFAVLSAFGIGWTYLLWAIAYMTVFMLIIRIRQVAEHAAVPDLYDPDPRLNTRTVDTPWWQRLMFVPNGVNFHMEHHFMASVPCYKLAELRRHLEQQGALEGVPRFGGYGQLIKHVIRPSGGAAAAAAA